MLPALVPVVVSTPQGPLSLCADLELCALYTYEVSHSMLLQWMWSSEQALIPRLHLAVKCTLDPRHSAEVWLRVTECCRLVRVGSDKTPDLPTCTLPHPVWKCPLGSRATPPTHRYKRTVYCPIPTALPQF